jgi:hypothetical protein
MGLNRPAPHTGVVDRRVSDACARFTILPEPDWPRNGGLPIAVLTEAGRGTVSAPLPGLSGLSIDQRCALASASLNVVLGRMTAAVLSQSG